MEGLKDKLASRAWGDEVVYDLEGCPKRLGIRVVCGEMGRRSELAKIPRGIEAMSGLMI